MMFRGYTYLYTWAALAAAPVYFAKGARSGKYVWSLRGRLGLDVADLGPKDRPRAWVHALSLGEVTSAEGLVRGAAERGWQPCLSTTTRSGYEAAARLLPGGPRLVPPLDFPVSVDRFLDRVRPDVFVVVETDFWPNLLAGLAGRGVPAVLVNGRISPRSLKGYRRVAGFWSRVLHLFAFIGCQTDADRDRFLSLGAPPDRTVTVGNLKYDRRPPDGGPPVRAALLEETGLPDGRYLVGGSTHPGEEDVLLGVFRRLGTDRPDLRLILAPRNPERSEAVWRSIQKTGLAAARRSAGPVSGHPAVFLLDTLGELDRFFELADVVFMGKSLDLPGEGGGHNLLEPAARSKPVVFGPRMHNFPQVADWMIQSGGGVQAAEADELEAAVARWLDRPEEARRAGCAARMAAGAHQGALSRALDLIHRAMIPAVGAA